MRIALDAMGGDHAPAATVEGAVEACSQNSQLSVILVGNETAIASELKKHKYSASQLSVKHASQKVEMDDSPMSALRRKKDSSIRIATDLLKSDDADGMVSAGNSGVVMATALLVLGKLSGVERPAIATVMPSLKGHFILIDAGANVDCKPVHLFQFGLMGEAYSRYIFNIENPKVGMLSIGEEDAKGNELTKESFKLLKNAGLNFIGNVEGRHIFEGDADVVVCDGFVGNIALKIAEGFAETTAKMLKREIVEKTAGEIGSHFLKKALSNFQKKTDYSEYGGAPLLGLNKPCIISHGRSTSKAIKNAVILAGMLHSKGILQIISKECKEGLAGRETVFIEE